MDRGGNYFLLQGDDDIEMSNFKNHSGVSRTGSNTRVNASSQPRLTGFGTSNQFTNPANLTHPPSENSLKIKCSKCPTELSYPADAYCVCCYNCKTFTAVKALSTHLCLVCLTNIFYLAEQKIVKCRCGKIYDFNKIQTRK